MATRSLHLWSYLFVLMRPVTCSAFNLDSITSSTLHLSRDNGVHNTVFGDMLLITCRGSI
uniref:BQ2448_1116 protein n=1 Tax=Microbotryum intermedium TaxID=269621 RepID=A0A238F786_9BASI|nr:BQ2448_1116 [Microbotryum intermedium]